MLGIPALEGVTLKPAVWVYPPGPKTEQILINPAYPPDYQDAIIWFPSHPQIAPIYLSLSVRRKELGVVTALGEDVPGEWLEHARSGLGAPIPTSIAESLRGRKYSSFDSFRRALWAEVSKDSELSSQLTTENKARVKNGLSPATRRQDIVGRRRVFELHYVEYIADGGAVYDVDNLRVSSPKNHIDIHR